MLVSSAVTTYRSAAPGQVCAVVSLKGGSVLCLEHATIICITTWNSLLRIHANTSFVTNYERPHYIM